MTETRKPTLIFDLDGTLIDSARDIQGAVNAMLQSVGQGPLSLATVTGFIGNGIPTLVDRVIRHKSLDPAAAPDLTARVLAHYADHPADLTRPYDNVPATLAALRDAGFALGICTNKPQAPAQQILDALDLSQYVDVVIGGDTLAQRKPDPAPLHAAFDALGTPYAYIGDSEVDAETARRADIPFGLFTRGYRKSAVEALPHRFAFDDFADLPAHIAAL